MAIYKNLVFILYKKCNASCSMCCFESTPHSTERLNTDSIKKYINFSKKISSITDISFTGGEPFLEYRRLLDLCRYAADKGKNVRTITNGYWATTYEKAEKRLLKLKESGVIKLTVSHDRYHKEFIKTEYVSNVLRAANEINLTCEITMVRLKNESVGEVIDEMGSSVNNIPINIIPCLPAGGARKLFDDGDFDRKINPENTRCHYGSSMVVSYDGNIYPCCSQTVFNTCLSVGNFENISLEEALYRLRNNSLLYLLRNESMADLVYWIRTYTDIEISERVVNVCELCEQIFSSDNLAKIKPYIENRINDIAKEKNYA